MENLLKHRKETRLNHEIERCDTNTKKENKNLKFRTYMENMAWIISAILAIFYSDILNVILYDKKIYR